MFGRNFKGHLFKGEENIKTHFKHISKLIRFKCCHLKYFPFGVRILLPNERINCCRFFSQRKKKSFFWNSQEICFNNNLFKLEKKKKSKHSSDRLSLFENEFYCNRVNGK